MPPPLSRIGFGASLLNSQRMHKMPPHRLGRRHCKPYRQPSPRRGRVGTAAGAWRGNAAPPFFWRSCRKSARFPGADPFRRRKADGRGKGEALLGPANPAPRRMGAGRDRWRRADQQHGGLKLGNPGGKEVAKGRTGQHYNGKPCQDAEIEGQGPPEPLAAAVGHGEDIVRAGGYCGDDGIG